MKRSILTLLCLLVVAGCGTREASWGVSPDDENRITLDVRNDNFLDARVFARFNGERRRLGLISGNSSEQFTLRGRTGSLRIEVDFIAGGSFLSDAVQVGPGDNLTFRIPARR